MTITPLVNAVKLRPDIRQLLLPTDQGGLGLTDAELTAMVKGQVNSVLDEMILAYEWDFAMNEYTDSTGSVADQSEYTVDGENSDCLQVASVKYGSSEKLLAFVTPAWLEDHLKRNTVATPLYWMRYGRDSNNLPIIKIVDTPDDSGDALKYRYWLSNIKLDDFHDSFQFVFESCIMKRLIPAFGGVFETDLGRAIAGYEPSTGAIRLTVLDEEITKANQRRAQLYGFSGT